MLNEIVEYNRNFVANKEYEKYRTSKFPDKKIAIVSCMDTRLMELLPSALGIKNGDAKIIKNAGGSISHPFGSVMRSLLVGIYELGIQEIFVIGHTDCGAQRMNSKEMVRKMIARGIPENSIEMMRYSRKDFDSWLSGFADVDTSVLESTNLIQKHPLIPEDVKVYGMVIDSVTGALRLLNNE